MNIVVLNFKKYEKVKQFSAWDATGSATVWLPGSGSGKKADPRIQIQGGKYQPKDKPQKTS